ncbi:MAG: sensor histidine kinase [Clostridiales bacterium]|nr:sensor histidine kinase [Clostridiales bacterium]
MKELSLHIMDVLQNSIGAESSKIKVMVEVGYREKYLAITVEDNGCGMEEETLRNSVDPFHTSRTTRKIGLGIPMFKEATELAEGTFEIESQEGKGTLVRAVLLNHSIDRQPLGDLGNTFFLTMISYVQLELCLELISTEGRYSFNSREHMKKMKEQGKGDIDAAFEAETLINEKVKDLFGKLLPEMGGDLSGIKGSR